MLPEMNRRGFLRMSAAAGAATLINPYWMLGQATAASDTVAQARQAAAKTPVKTTQLYDSVFLLQGAGGNMAAQFGDDGVNLVDSSFSTAAPAILEAINTIDKEQAGTLINTHWHFDHTDGNERLNQAGFSIVAHQKTRDRLSSPQTIKAFNLSLPAAPKTAWPALTFDSSLHLWLNDDSIDIVHFEPAHTDTDVYIHFHNANVLHLGDTFFNGIYPFIDESSGGSIGGMIAANEKALSIAENNTKIIPGHGPLGTKADLQSFHDMLSGLRDKVASLKKSGSSEQEVIAAKPTAQWDPIWGKSSMSADLLAGIAYRTI
jgi:glyoxylase-like metal-dependent hydrolase (beta-lactamase superfamily II)